MVVVGDYCPQGLGRRFPDRPKKVCRLPSAHARTYIIRIRIGTPIKKTISALRSHPPSAHFSLNMVSAAFDTGCNGFTKPIQYKKRQRTSMEQQWPASTTRADPESNNNQHHSPLEGRMCHAPMTDKRLDGPKNLPPSRHAA
jgi:hypothetical protein